MTTLRLRRVLVTGTLGVAALSGVGIAAATHAAAADTTTTTTKPSTTDSTKDKAGCDHDGAGRGARPANDASTTSS